MAKVIHLAEGIDPPEKESSLIVARDVTGAFYVVTSEAGYRRSTAPSSAPISEADRTAAIDRAKVYADQSGIHTVYVVT
jgi:hypothetical protein